MKKTLQELNEQDRLQTGNIQLLFIVLWIVLGLLAYSVTAYEIELEKKSTIKTVEHKKSPGAQTAGL